MSSETSAWAKEQRCGDPVTKAVLMEIANWAKPTGYCEFLSVKRIAEVTEVSVRTVQRHIMRLESLDRAAGGLGLIRRDVRHRDDGGQGANSFELIGYTMPQPAPIAPVSPPRQSVTPPRQDDMPPRQIDGEPGDNRVTRLGDKILPPSPPDGGETPTPILEPEVSGDRPVAAGQPRPHILPADWEPPVWADLPPTQRALVQQWPAGAYEAVCETFRLHWASETRAVGRKRDWAAALGKWLISDHPKVMRDAKAGVSFAALAPKRAGDGPAQSVAIPATPAKARETAWSVALHGVIRSTLGAAVWSQWFEPSALLIEETGDRGIGVTVIAASEFHRSWIEERHTPFLRKAARGVTGSEPRWVRFDVERPSGPSKEASNAQG